MTNLLHEELARRGSLVFDEAGVLATVRRKVVARRLRRERMTVGAAGLVVVALVVGAVTFSHRAPQPASPSVPGVVVSAAPAVPVAPGVLASAATAVQERLTDVAGVAVDPTAAGGLVASGPAWARDRIIDAVTAEGRWSVRPVLAANADLRSPTMSTLPAQPEGSTQDDQAWQESALAAAGKGALPCRRTVAPVVSTLPLVSCNQQDGSVAVLSPSIVSGPVSAEVVKDPTGQSEWVLSVTFDEAGRRDFGSYTVGHVGARTAFTIDNQTISTPAIAGPITTGNVTVQSNLSEAQLQEYAQELTHPLPTRFNVTDVSSTR